VATARSAQAAGNAWARVGAGDLDRRLSGVADPLGDGVQHQRSAGDGFFMPIRFGQTNEDVSPMIKQGHQARRQPAARQIMRDEAAPAH